jgi:hypothetical protein
VAGLILVSAVAVLAMVPLWLGAAALDQLRLTGRLQVGCPFAKSLRAGDKSGAEAITPDQRSTAGAAFGGKRGDVNARRNAPPRKPSVDDALR